MYPEAGGSSSFARRAFNEFWSFFAAWGQMLTYIITVSISAFFVPHYLGVFWEPLGESPGGHRRRDHRGGRPGRRERHRREGVGGRERVLRGRRLPDAGPARGRGHRARVLAGHARRQRDFWTSPTLGDFLIAIPVGMVAYTGIETISNMAEEARDYGHTIPRGIGGVVIAVAVIYTFLPAVALSAMPVEDGDDGTRPLEGGGGLRRRSHPRRGREHRLRRPPERGGDLRRHPGGHDPLHRDQRGVDRGLAAHLLDGAAPAAARAPAPAPSPLPDALHRDRVFGAVAALAIVPGQAEFLGTIYAFGAMLSFTIAHVSVCVLRIKQPDVERPYRSPGNIRFGALRAAAAVGARRPRHRDRAAWWSRSSTSRR